MAYRLDHFGILVEQQMIKSICMTQDNFPIRPYTPKELAKLYRCSVRTMTKWIQPFGKEIGPRIGHFYNPRQVKIIAAQLGTP